MINIQGYAGNPNFRVTTSIQNKKKNKKNPFKNIIISSAIIGTGGIIGDIYAKKKYPEKLKETRNRLAKTIEEIKEFIKSPEKNDPQTVKRHSGSPYDAMVLYFEKMKQIKYRPLIENANCIAFISEDEKRAKEVIDWFAHASRQKYYEVDLFDKDFDLVEFLEQMEENYQKTKDWNLIYVKDLDKAINPSEVEDAVIASMKSIMCATEKDYHSTLLFYTKDVTKLDDTAIETNRVNEFFKVDNFKHFDEFKKIYNEYNKELDLIEKLENSKKQFRLKHLGIGATIGAIVAMGLIVIKKVIDKNKAVRKNEN